MGVWAAGNHRIAQNHSVRPDRIRPSSYRAIDKFLIPEIPQAAAQMPCRRESAHQDFLRVHIPLLRMLPDNSHCLCQLSEGRWKMVGLHAVIQQKAVVSHGQKLHHNRFRLPVRPHPVSASRADDDSRPPLLQIHADCIQNIAVKLHRPGYLSLHRNLNLLIPHIFYPPGCSPLSPGLY